MRKAFFLGLSFGIKTLCALVAVRLLAEKIGGEGFGYLTQYMSFLAVIFGLALGGGSNYLVKMLAQAENKKQFNDEISVSFTYGMLFLLVILVLLSVFKRELELYVFYQPISWGMILYIVLLYLIANIYGCLSAAAMALGHIRLYSISVACGAIVYAAIVAVVMHYGMQGLVYWVVPLAYVLPVIFFAASGATRISIKFDLLFKHGRIVDVFRYCLVVYVGLISLPLVSLVVREIFNNKYGAVELSYWQVAVKFSDTLQQCYGMFCAVLLLPYLARTISKSNFSSWLFKLSLLSVLYFLLAGVVYIFRAELILILFGQSYADAGNYFIYYLIGDYFRACGLFCSFSLIAAGLFARALVFEILQGVGYILFFWCLQGRYGVADAGISYLFTYLVCSMVMIFYVYKYFEGL